MKASLGRIGAMMTRYMYLYRVSPIRILELVYWPTFNMLIWGFMQEYLRSATHPAVFAASYLIAAVLLWDVLFRSQLGLTLGFVEEMWARNLGHLAVSPLRPLEFVGALIATSLLRTLVAVGGAGFLATVFFGFNALELGFGLALFFLNLVIMGWGVGLAVCAILLRYGLAAEALAWGALFVLQPLCGVFYPVSVLPDWLEPVARALPATHVFEGMRAVVQDGRLDLDLLAQAFLLNIPYALAGLAAFLGAYAVARRRGLLMGTGE